MLFVVHNLPTKYLLPSILLLPFYQSHTWLKWLKYLISNNAQKQALFQL